MPLFVIVVDVFKALPNTPPDIDNHAVEKIVPITSNSLTGASIPIPTLPFQVIIIFGIVFATGFKVPVENVSHYQFL